MSTYDSTTVPSTALRPCTTHCRRCLLPAPALAVPPLYVIHETDACGACTQSGGLPILLTPTELEHGVRTWLSILEG